MDINVIGRSLWLMSNLTGHYRHWPANNVIGRIIVFVRNIYRVINKNPNQSKRCKLSVTS
jgi:hypothetical protein